MVSQNDKYKPYPMIMIDNNMKNTLSTQEFYIWCWLRYRYIMYTANHTSTSVDIMNEYIKFYQNESKNKKCIKNILLKLQKEKHINIQCDEIKNNSALEITFPNIEPSNNYTALDNKYINIEDHRELYIIATIRQWQYATNKTFSLSEWAGILDVSQRTIQDIFKNMQDKGLIYIQSGNYYLTDSKQLRQENNKYYLVDDKFNTVTEEQVEKEKLEEEQDRAKLKTAKEQKFKEKTEEKLNEALEKITDSRILERDNLIRDGVTMEDEDFYIYVTTDDPLVKELADAKFGRISNSDSGKKFIENSIRKARKKKAEIEKHKRQQEEWLRGAAPPDSEIHVDEGYDSGEEDRIRVLYMERKKREEEERRKEMGIGEK